MEDVSNINFQNENCPIDNLKVNSDDILNRSAENKVSATESVAFLHSSPLNEKQVLTNVNNNFQNEKPSTGYSCTEYSTAEVSNNSVENISCLSSEPGSTKAEDINSHLAFETSLITDTSCNISFKSVENTAFEDEFKIDSDAKSSVVGVNEISGGNVNFPQDALSDDVLMGNQKNLSINAAKCIEIEKIDFTSTGTDKLGGEKDGFHVIDPELVDFSFREQENTTDNLLQSFSDSEFLSKQPISTSIDTVGKISDNSPINNQDKQLLSTSIEVSETDFANKVAESPTSIHKESGITDFTEKHAVTLEDSVDNEALLGVSETSLKKVSNVIASVDTSVEFEKPSIPAEEASVVDSVKLDILTNNECKENIDEVSFQIPENISSNSSDEVSPLKVGKVSFGMSDKSPEKFADPDFQSEVPSNNPIEKFGDPEFQSEVPFNIPVEQFADSEFQLEVPSNNPVEQFADPDFKLEMSSNNPIERFASPQLELEVPSNNPVEQFASPQLESEVPSNNPVEGFASPQLESEVPLNNPVEQFAKPEFESKVPSNNPLEQFAEADFKFKVPEVPPHNPFEQLSDLDFAFKVPEDPSNSPRGQFPDFAKMQDNIVTGEDDEQFVDAAQFFRDPNSFQFLENIRTSSAEPRSAVPRSSLFVNFDPLHSKFQANGPRQDNCALITAAVQENTVSMEDSEKGSPAVLNKNLAARESLGNILISFDSPKPVSCVDSKTLVQDTTPPKMFTEEEVQQKLKIHELETQDAFLKKQREMELQIVKKDEILRFQQIVNEEICGISVKLSEDVKNSQEKIMSLEALNEKLKEDLKTSNEDQQSVENTFTDFYKRYEQCKGMLKTYKDNEEHLKQTIVDLQTKAKEQEQMYNMLHERTEEMLEKANVEVENVKRSGEAQVTVLKAQLKKAEMKISSLESDIKQIKIENSQLGGICDDLMAKVSRS